MSLSEKSTEAVMNIDAISQSIRESLDDLNEAMNTLRDDNLPHAAHWTVKAWRCRRKGVSTSMETKTLETDAWEGIPNLTWLLLEWQLEMASHDDEFLPDPGPLHIEYHPENEESGSGAFSSHADPSSATS